MPALMDKTIGKCITCDSDRTSAHPQCDECRKKVTTKYIEEKFNGRYTMPYAEFVKMIGYVELRSWDTSGRDDNREISIGIVDGRYFWVMYDDGKAWHDEFGFLDEMKPEHS